MLRQRSLQLSTYGREDLDIVLEVGEDPLDGNADGFADRIIGWWLPRKGDGCFLDGIEQLPSRMIPPGEKRPIQYRGLEHRDLKSSKQGLDRIGNHLVEDPRAL